MIKMKGIIKHFGKLIANNNIDFEVAKGEVHALLGENGAGKSTLMSILFGLYKADQGEIFINDELVEINNPNDATRLNIGMVHQHFKLVETFTVLENIILGMENTNKGFLTTKEARVKINSIMEKYNLYVDLDEVIYNLTVGQQQKVEIIKVLYRDSEILIFDEPTAVLTPQEIEELLGILRNFAKEDKTVILITHKLNEIKASSDRCTILRRGEKIATVKVSSTSTKELSEMMVGRPIKQEYDIEPFEVGKTILDVNNLNILGTGKNLLTNVSFNVKEGEIVGIAGIDGNGQTELISAITGLLNVNSGSILLNDNDITRLSIRKRFEAGLSHIPEDRQKNGLVLDFDIANNLILQSYYKEPFSKKGFLNKDSIYNNADEMIEKYDIRSAAGATTKTRSMSGGNQQKAIIAREIERDHNLLIAFQPTRGLDVGAIENIHAQLLAEQQKGKGILLVSFELEEILSITNRILVMYEGEIIGEFNSSDVTANELGLYMSGSKRGITQ